MKTTSPGTVVLVVRFGENSSADPRPELNSEKNPDKRLDKKLDRKPEKKLERKKDTISFLKSKLTKARPVTEFVLVDSITEEREISLFETSLQNGDDNPLDALYSMREREAVEEEEFGDYVEELLTQSFVREEVRQHGLEWLRSKMKIEQFRKSENDATQVIANFAFKIFSDDPQKKEFLLSGPSASVKIRVILLPRVTKTSVPSTRVA